MDFYLLLFSFALVAFFYSSIGFGGGSTYLALLSLLLTDFFEIRTLSLLLNIAVVTLGTFFSIRKQLFDWKAFWPLLVFSLPGVFAGTQLQLTQAAFFIVLGVSLLLSAAALATQLYLKKRPERSLPWYKAGLLGAGVGFLSGVAGIGGGIFLAPVLNLLGWKNPKIVASLASAFILLNSTMGLFGLWVADSFSIAKTYPLPLLAAVMAGAVLGTSVSHLRFDARIIKSLTAALVAYVGLKLILFNIFGIRI